MFSNYVDPIAQALGPWASEITLASITLRILLAAFLAFIVGCERSSKRHAAGLRTFMLITISSSINMMIDCYISQIVQNHFYILSATTIIAVAIICTNCVLYSSRSQIKGLTTSAALWTCSVLGLTSGAAFFTVTLVAFALLMICLSAMPYFETFLKNRSNHFEVHLELKSSQYLQEFVATIRKLGLFIDDIELNPAYANSGLSVYSVALSIHGAELKKYKTHKEIIEALKTLDYVYFIEEMRS
ncbi:MAG: MgtC/SapB family protein [Clostridia bacterium]|nr:MgtC/SapB family protein [Clostridia bacterium]